MFEGFDLEDFWLVTSAQRVAARRLYPQLSHLVQELNGLVAEDGLVYCNTSTNAIAHWQSLQFGSPGAWTRSYFLAPYWSTAWPLAPPRDLRAALYVMFNFWAAQVEVGFFFQPIDPADRPAWVAAAKEVADCLRSLPPPVEVVSDPGGWTRTAEARPPADVDDAWLQGIVSRGGHLRFHTALDPAEVTSALQLREVLVVTRDFVTERPLILELIGKKAALSVDAEAADTADE